MEPQIEALGREPDSGGSRRQAARYRQYGYQLLLLVEGLLVNICSSGSSAEGALSTAAAAASSIAALHRSPPPKPRPREGTVAASAASAAPSVVEQVRSLKEGRRELLQRYIVVALLSALRHLHVLIGPLQRSEQTATAAGDDVDEDAANSTDLASRLAEALLFHAEPLLQWLEPQPAGRGGGRATQSYRSKPYRREELSIGLPTVESKTEFERLGYVGRTPEVSNRVFPNNKK
jgi:hypothetical protein